MKFQQRCSKSTTTKIQVKLTNVHSARATDAFSARSPEGQSGVHLILDLDEGVEDHGATVVQVNLELLHLGLVSGILRVISITNNNKSILKI
jgi:hypothetical protein